MTQSLSTALATICAGGWVLNVLAVVSGTGWWANYLLVIVLPVCFVFEVVIARGRGDVADVADSWLDSYEHYRSKTGHHPLGAAYRATFYAIMRRDPI